MINEIHSCLLYRKPLNNQVVGEDYQAPGIDYEQLSPAARNIHRVLLVNPDRPETANWRCVELRKLIEQTDIGTLRVRFDTREGYCLSELVDEMVQYFRPVVNGTPYPGEVNVHGRFRKPGYQLTSWYISIKSNQWRITSEFGETQGNVDSQPLITTQLPGHDSNIQFSAKQDGDYIVRWASIPSETLTDTAKLIRETHLGSLDYLANDENSKYEYEERQYLRRIAAGQGEVGAQVCAAALLFIGHSSQYVSINQSNSTQAAGL